ncbi:MAG: FecR family protein [Janthinobacterium lividum]
MAPDYPDYTTFQTEDFVLDDSFQAFVTGSDAPAAAFWQQWLAAHPAQQPAAEQARHLVLLLSRAQPPVASAQRKEQDLQRLRRAIHQPQPAPVLRVQRQRLRRLVGSLLLVLLALGAGFWLWPAAGLGQKQYTTRAGEQRTVRLPDGSVVVLNGNSRLTTAASWKAQSPREVWLEGEAFFRVSHLTRVPNLPVAQATGNAKFVVHAGELNVSVLGTTFNVINRPAGFNKVTLNSGKVLVEHATLFGHDELLMAPGELVEYAPSGPSLAKRSVEPARFSAWVNNSLEFDHTPMSEIIRLFRDTYGLELVVEDPALLRQTVTGSMPSKSADILLQALAKSLGVRAERHGNKVYLLPL